MEIEALTEEELFQYLSVELGKDIAEVMKSQHVSGKDFLDLTEEHLKSILPLVGDRMKVLRLKSEHCLTVTKKVEEAVTSDARREKLSQVCMNVARYLQYKRHGSKLHIVKEEEGKEKQQLTGPEPATSSRIFGS